MNERRYKNNKGITLISLIITVAVMLIIVGTTVYTSLDRFEINRLKKMYNDIELLSDKVENYYLKYNGLPIKEQYTYTTLDFDKNANDNGNYYIIDLEAIEGISLNYGKEGYNRPNESDDVYIINEKSHTIYYVKGIEVDGTTYHYIKKKTEILDTIPPTKPEINVVEGDFRKKGTFEGYEYEYYFGNLLLELIPGKDNLTEEQTTTYTIRKDGVVLESREISQNTMLPIEDGVNQITLTTYNNKRSIFKHYI